MVSPRTVLVTGGAGFIGSHLVDKLIEFGHRVIVVDDLSTGRLLNVNKRAFFHHASITSPIVEEIIARERPHVVSHHAGQSNLSLSVRDPVKDASINIEGSVRLIEACRHHGVGLVIYGSSASVYGEPQYTPCDEGHPIEPISPFGLSNYVVEEYLRLYNLLHRLDYRVLRYANVYGPCRNLHEESGIIASFTSSMMQGKQPRIFGTGEHERDFVYIDDVVDAHMRAMERGTVGAYNVGTGNSISVNGVFQLMKEVMGYRWTPTYAPQRPGDISRISLNPAKAAQELGWHPTVDLEEGIRRTVAESGHTVHSAA